MIPSEIEIPVWWSPGGGMMYNRYALEPNHPEHPYNYVRRVYNVDPEIFGIEFEASAGEKREYEEMKDWVLKERYGF